MRRGGGHAGYEPGQLVDPTDAFGDKFPEVDETPDCGPTGGHVPASGEESHESEAARHATDDLAEFFHGGGIVGLARGEDFGAVMEGGDVAILFGHEASLVGETASALVRNAFCLDAG